MSVHFSAMSVSWATPASLFRELNHEFGFTLDPCASAENAKADRFFSESDDGLSKPWSGEIVFMNPPYGKAIAGWMKKAYLESRNGATVVCLIPSRTDTGWWHEYAMRADQIRFIRGRVRFGDGLGDAPFPSAIVVFTPQKQR